MRVLLDECLPRRLRLAFPDHEVSTVPEAGWSGRSNGDLLTLAKDRFDVFITIDRNLAAQQPLAGMRLGVIVLRASSNRFEDLKALVPEITKALASIRPGDVVRLGG
ncbi:MAG: DUF5615 family PIN-like protein [Acidobacteriia bacterium]|nr:DUF5615 family PIN-like protein [Terriglobia bacterium]